MMTATNHPQLDWLYSTQLFGIKLGLDNVHRLLQAMELPGAVMKFIHVAGTNGKGSTCAFIHAVLKAADLKAGLFTSPHLVRFNERIRDTEREITDDEIEVGLARIRALITDWETHPTFFEITLALALDWFRQRGVSWVVLETGLGGRLDATNALMPEVTVITRIGMDHQEQLGNTLTKIATEKAGIIKPGIPLVTGLQDPASLAVIKSVCKAQKAPLNLVDTPLTEVKLGLEGPHQAWNAALALEAIREAGVRLPALMLEKALRDVSWRGRFERLQGGGVIVDGAHNPEAAFVLAATWQTTFPGETVEIILATARDKDFAGVLESLNPIASAWHFTTFHSPRALPTAKMREILNESDLQDLPVTEHADLASALRHCDGRRVLIAGSLYLVGEALALFADEAETFQPSLQ
jgi:dihydrofolate synthase/folylpolyglutamate synthase